MKKLPLYAVGTALVIFSAVRTLWRSLPRLPQDTSIFGFDLPKQSWFFFPGLMLLLAAGLLVPWKKIPYPASAAVEILPEEKKELLASLWKEIRFAGIFLCELAVLFGMKALLTGALGLSAGWERANALFIIVLAGIYLFHYSSAVRRAAALPTEPSTGA